jgi:hypothetical protein
MGATLGEAWRSWGALWLQTLIYGLAAAYLIGLRRRRGEIMLVAWEQSLLFETLTIRTEDAVLFAPIAARLARLSAFDLRLSAQLPMHSEMGDRGDSQTYSSATNRDHERDPRIHALEPYVELVRDLGDKSK